MKITNTHGVSLPLAVWLLHDEYDYVREAFYISATSLLKSTKQILLGKRVQSEDREMDIADLIASRFGHATHDSIEKAWKIGYKDAMLKLGYPQSIIDRMVINPTSEYLAENADAISIYIEKRAIREITVRGKTFKIGGKFDMVIDGRLFDTKTTSVYAFTKGSKDDDYSLQGSIYRWLNPEIITDEDVFIQFIFTDWQKSAARQQKDKGYPQIKIAEHPVRMHSVEDTERFIEAKIGELLRLWDAPEDQMPECTDKELWRSEPQFKYYSDPAKANDPNARSTKNFDDLASARAYQAEKGGKGVIVTKPGEVKACAYCAAFDICKQKDQYFVEYYRP